MTVVFGTATFALDGGDLRAALARVGRPGWRPRPVTAGQPVLAGLAGLAVSYLAASTTGGTGRDVPMLASGCAARGAAVTVYGPAAAGPAGEPGTPGWP